MVSLNQTGESKKSGNANSRRQGTITHTPIANDKNVYRIRYTLPAEKNGKQKRVTETVRGTKTYAQKTLTKRLAQLEAKRHVDKTKLTVAGFIQDWFENHIADDKITLRTAQGYRGYIDRYIIPTIGPIRLQDLEPVDIKKIYNDMKGRGLSNTTVVQAHRILRKALNDAVQSDPPLLPRNPADSKTSQPPKKRKYQVKVWDVPTIHKFLELSKGTRFGYVYEFALSTGMRRSEISGLKWESVDLPDGDDEKGSLSVVSTLHRIKGHGLVEADPKTEGSRRPVTLSSPVVNLLREVRLTQQLSKMEFGPLWQDTGFVFTHPNGTPLIPDQITQDFASLVKRFGLPHLTFHGLRHAYATLALRQGIQPKVVSKAMGHSKVGITMDLYQHVLDEMQDELADAISDVLIGAD